MADAESILGSLDMKDFKMLTPCPVTFEIGNIGQIVLLGINSAILSRSSESLTNIGLRLQADPFKIFPSVFIVS